MKYTKEQLEKFILVDKLSYRKIGRILGVSDTLVKRKARELGIKLPVRKKFPDNYEWKGGLRKKLRTCENCGTQCTHRFCSKKCSSEAYSTAKYKDFRENNEKYCRASYSPKPFKPQFLKEQDCKCAICGIENKWNGKPLMFVLDHIDGDASNNKRNNLRLICSNCDSQLDTYKSKNKNSARKERYLLNYKNL